jgi:TPR repeat protein
VLLPDKQVFVTNFTPLAAEGQNLNIRALPTGNTVAGGHVLELWDCGTTPTSAQLADRAQLEAYRLADLQAQQAAAKAASAQALAEKNRALLAPALKYYQGLADQGDAFGQFRMGEFYRDGDAVPKDLAKAKDYFTKSAAQGNQAASIALEKMNPPAP